MRLNRYIFLFTLLIFIGASFQKASAQLGFQPDITKPKPYENRVLKAEKTGTGKLKNSKKFLQNLTTHYNYYFNASNKLNEVIDRAKEAYRDDYTNLLPFYNYSLDVTSLDKVQLDSVIYKSKTGIINHDLRNDWMDNLYLLWGAAFYLQKKFDSASQMFQFINYSFAEKEKDGYYRYIGSNMDGNNALSISTKEKTGFTTNLLTTPPSRNDAFIWQIRTLIESGNMAEASSLIATLKNDLSFPVRLHPELEEVQAYWFYKQNMLDSSAAHLVNALDQPKTKQERARWEYLSAQMYEKTGKPEEAEKLYNKVLSHTTDPIMEIYTRLNLVRINKSGGENYIDKNIEELVKMARKDKYEEYRDVIYFMAGQMELDRNHKDAAQAYFLKSAKYNNGNISSKNSAFLTIADLLYDQKKYLLAAPYYDSIQSIRLASYSPGQTNWSDPELMGRIDKRKAILSKLVAENSVIIRQDSLQKIAAMPEQERTAYLTRLLKQIRKQQGIRDETITSGSAPLNNAPDLFNNATKGEWYFYNATLKASGSVQFKQIWGSRPNVDNWRRFADVNQQLISKSPNNTRPENGIGLPANNIISINSLSANLPIGELRLQASNDSIKNALFNSGNIYMNELEDYPTAIETFEALRSRFPDYSKMEEALFGLYYSYNKSGNISKAEEIKKIMASKYASSRLTSIVNTGKDPSINVNYSESTKAYENIYDMFIEGKFEEAEAAKKNADSIYRTNHWQPQLLYIEAVYYIRQRNDSIAKNVLQTLIGQNSGTPLANKAQNLLQVLNRRKQIEEELINLKVERIPEDSVIAEPLPVVSRPHLVRNDSNLIKTKPPVLISANPQKPGDTTLKNPIVKNKVPGIYRFDPAMKHFVVIILDKVDAVFVNEAKVAFNRYNQEQFYSQQYTTDIVDLDADHKLLLVGNFTNAQAAIDYIPPTKRLAPNEIVPWLKKEKYSFSILSEYNLEVLKERKDLEQYRKFLDQNLPGKF